MTDAKTTERQEIEAQIQTTLDTIQKAVLGLLLQEGKTDPRLIVLALAHVTGELAAAMALAGDEALEEMLADITEIVRQVGRGHHQDLQAVVKPVAGSA